MEKTLGGGKVRGEVRRERGGGGRRGRGESKQEGKNKTCDWG